MIAIVAMYNRFKGCGWAVPANEFGQPDETRPDIFVHARNVKNKRYLAKGDLIAYEMGEHQGRPTAKEVFVLAEARPEEKVRP